MRLEFVNHASLITTAGSLRIISDPWLEDKVFKVPHTNVCTVLDDQLRLVVESFDGTVVDGHPEIVEDVVFMAPHQPREVAQRGEPRVRRPPEPAREVPLRPAGPVVLPEVAEELFEKIRAVDLAVEPFEGAKAQGLGYELSWQAVVRSVLRRLRPSLKAAK